MGRKLPELEDLVELPDSMQYVWSWFIELHNARTSNGFGLNPITYADIKAYFDLYDIVPQDWQVQLIKQLDNVALNAFAKQQKEEAEKAKKKKSDK